VADFPLAQTTSVLAATRYAHLFIYVEGYTTGYDGKLLIERSPERHLIPKFVIYAAPGNDGIIPSDPPVRRLTTAVAAFPAGGIGNTIRIEDAAGVREVPVIGGGHEPIVAESAKAVTGWTATHNMMPGSSHHLLVSGIVTAPTTEWDAWLVKAKPQGTNDKILLLNVVAFAPTGIVLPIVAPLSVKYSENTPTRYQQVQVTPHDLLPAGITVGVVNFE
jgi:hypothetical protein